MAASTGSGSTLRTTATEQVAMGGSSARKARRAATLDTNSHETMLRDLDALERLLERVRSWKTNSLTDEKVKFETAAHIEMSISKQMLSLHVESLDSILLQEEGNDEDTPEGC